MRIRVLMFMLLAASLLPSMAGVWSLDECINYALEHNLTIKSQQLQAQSGELDVTEAKDGFLPTLSAGASESFAFGRGLTSENTYANRNTTSFGWSVGLNLPLFQGLSAVRRLNYSKANLLALVEQVEATKDDVTLNVMAAYLQALYCKELLDVATEQRKLSKMELERRQVLLENGKIPELDVLEATSQLATDELSEVNAANDYKLALVDLAQLLRLNIVEGFAVAPLDDEHLALYSQTADEIYATALENNHSLVAARRQIAASDKQVELARSGYLPSLSFSLGLGSSYYHLAGQYNMPFSRQMRDNYATNLGFTLSVPIFDAFSTRNSIRKAKLSKATAELSYETAMDNVFKNIQQAYYQAVGAEKKLTSSLAARESAKAAFDAMQVKYNLGRANATEYEQSKSSYIQAVSQHVQAKYELILRNRILAFYDRR